VLADVQDQRQVLVGQVVGQCVDERARGLLLDVEDRGHRRNDLGFVLDGTQVDHPCAVGEVAGQGPAELPGQPALAEAAGAGQRDEPVSCQEPAHLAGLGFAANESRLLLGDIVARGRWGGLLAAARRSPTTSCR
jgi:hypothetical protein